MKRLVLLTLLLVPATIQTVGGMSSTCRPSVTIGPRTARASSDPAGGESDTTAFREVRHLPMATPERARAEARSAVLAALAAWLEPHGVPTDWEPPAGLVSALIQEGDLEVVERPYGTLYIQPVTLEMSPVSRDRLLESYERDLAGRRLAGLAGVLTFVLTCLAAVAGYIRADEATWGYYTNTLRVAAVGAVGAAGALIYLALA